MMKKQNEEFNPEKRLRELSGSLIKKGFLLIITLMGYWQIYEYVSEKPNLNIELKKSVFQNKKYISEIEIKNGSESFSNEDIISPIEILFSENIQQLQESNSNIKLNYQIEKTTIRTSFDLLNKNEKISFHIISEKRPQITNVKYRIKGIENINFYDYEFKPPPILRIFNIWLVFLIISILTFFDSLLVIIKDNGLGKIKAFVRDFPLSESNREEFIDSYKKLYSEYKLKLKPSTKFMGDFTVRNLVYMYKVYKKNDVEFIKHVINLKTELYIFYRLRTVFVVLSPMIFIIALFGMIFNYIYYEFDITYKYLSLDIINKILVTLLLLVILYIIFNPRKTLNNVLLTKDTKIKF